jgi:hypothetical protein
MGLQRTRRGTTFKIYLPRTDEPLSVVTPSVKSHVRGTETILVVEDEAEVRQLAMAGLESFGYAVHGASRGKDALAFCAGFADKIDLVVTDVVMPDMNGRESPCKLVRCVPIPEFSSCPAILPTSSPIAEYWRITWSTYRSQFTPESLARRIREVFAQ